MESVAWVAERKDVLSTLFWMLTMWAYVRYVEHKVKGQRSKVQGKTLLDPCLQRYLLVLLFVLGLMSKPMLVTLPFVLLLLDYWPLDRFQPDPWRTEAWPLIREKIPLFVLSAASGGVTFVVQQSGGMVKPIDDFPLSGRFANGLVSYVNYILKMIWPHDLAVLYPYPEAFPFWKIAGAGALLVGVSMLAVRAAKSYPYLAVGWLWYLGTLVPVIGFVQVGLQAMADRYTYVPLIGLFVMIAFGARDLLSPWSSRAIRVAPLACLALGVLLVTARIQVSFWQNSIRLFEHALAATTNNPIMHNMLGLVLAGKGRLQEGIAHFTEALRINPLYAEPQNNLALALAKQGRVGEAISHYVQVLRKNPNNAEAHNYLGNILCDQGQSREAIFHLTEALRIRPHYREAHNNLAIALAQRGEIEEAMVHCAEALRTDPDYAEAHNNLGTILDQQGKTEEAMVHYVEALRLKPGYAEARNNLGVSLARQGKVDEAMTHFEKAIATDPRYERAYHNIGVALAGQGKKREAIGHYAEALRIKPAFAEARYSLGLAYAAVGDHASALEQHKILMTMNPGLANRLLGKISK